MTVTDDDSEHAVQDEVGIKPTRATGSFTDLAEDVHQPIARITAGPFIPHKDDIRVFVLDVATGKRDEVISNT
ncbi:carbonic anhydrase, partial [Nocardia paucivorans]|uniref:carbonic anhydrase n=1 Tax=Nocardia paucivorans TaxID=114259 RepID=UPI000319849D